MLNWLIVVIAVLVVTLTLGAVKKVAETSGLSYDVVILSGAALLFFVLWKKNKLDGHLLIESQTLFT